MYILYKVIQQPHNQAGEFPSCMVVRQFKAPYVYVKTSSTR